MKATGKFMQAKFKSECAETTKVIRKGEHIYYDWKERKAYCLTSERYKKEEMREESENVSGYIQAQENAYFDRFTQSGRY